MKKQSHFLEETDNLEQESDSAEDPFECYSLPFYCALFKWLNSQVSSGRTDGFDEMSMDPSCSNDVIESDDETQCLYAEDLLT